MDNCKRPRLEIINGTLRRGNATQKSFILSQNLAEDIIDMNNSGVTATTTTTTISNAATTTTTTTTALPGNVFLTICDDNSNESHDEFISIENGCIKREPNLTETAQRHMGVNVGLTSINTQTAAALLPATVQLPSGCEIYLVKEYLNPPPLTPTNAPRTVISSTTTTAKNNNQIKLENTQINPVVATTTTTTTTNQVGKSGLQIKRKCNNFHSNVQQPVILNNNNNNNIIDNNTIIGLIDERTDFEKQSELLEAYKKRDDKRRATHNEVERRRRDKINSWIFKLKEMLPNEIPNYVPIESESCNNNSNSNSSTSDQQGLSNNNNNNRNCRNLPCDSKSQILIKACEYIKAMQQELKNLRDCLTEQESIRQRNEQLQHELNELKNVHLAVSVMEEDEDDAIVAHCNNHLSVAASDDAVDGHVDDLTHNLNSNPNSNFNVTLNSLNNLGGDSLFMSTTNTGNASLVAVVESKRELLMREFVD